jgi:hypothetical protein
MSAVLCLSAILYSVFFWIIVASCSLKDELVFMLLIVDGSQSERCNIIAGCSCNITESLQERHSSVPPLNQEKRKSFAFSHLSPFRILLVVQIKPSRM